MSILESMWVNGRIRHEGETDIPLLWTKEQCLVWLSAEVQNGTDPGVCCGLIQMSVKRGVSSGKENGSAIPDKKLANDDGENTGVDAGKAS